MNSKHFHDYFIHPTLTCMTNVIHPPKKMDSLTARRLLLGTALAESGLMHLKQLGGGPALGFYQMEPATYRDIFINYITRKKYLQDIVGELGPMPSWTQLHNGENFMITDFNFATIMARIHYWRVSEPLPEDESPIELATYYKKYYNTSKGKADIEKSIPHFEKAIELIEE